MPAYFESEMLGLDSNETLYEAIYGFELCKEKEYQVNIAARHLLEIYQKQTQEFEDYGYAEEAYLKEHYEKIIRTANKLLEKENELSNEDKIKVYMARASNYLILEKYNDARSDFEKALVFDSKNIQVLYDLAWIEN